MLFGSSNHHNLEVMNHFIYYSISGIQLLHTHTYKHTYTMNQGQKESEKMKHGKEIGAVGG